MKAEIKSEETTSSRSESSGGGTATGEARIAGRSEASGED